MALVIGRRNKGSGPEPDPEGRMTLAEHLRELRSRLFKSALAVVAFGIVGFVFRDQIVEFMTQSASEAAEELGRTYQSTFTKIADPLFVPMRIAMVTGFIFGAPVWIYQLWQFITPALYRGEKKWATVVLATAVPMFLSGVGLAIWIMPKAWRFLIEFTPPDVDNLIPVTEFISFYIRLTLVFGIGFLLPIFVVLLNAAGILRHETLSNARRWVIVGIFVFGGVATPTGDPITLLAFAMPMWLLFEVAVVICRMNDRRHARATGLDIADDEATPDEILDQIGRDDSDDDDKSS